jgi:hypothetical protein
MRRRTMLVASSLFTTFALALAPPKTADAAMICPPNPLTGCSTTCPALAYCYTHFHMLGCPPAYDIVCGSNPTACPASAGCCDMSSGAGCDWDPDNPPQGYCATVAADCYF